MRHHLQGARMHGLSLSHLFVDNVTPTFYYPGQQQYLSYVYSDSIQGAGAVDPVQAAMRGWTEASTQNMTLAVEIKNVQFVLSQIILPDVISVAVISTAAGSAISIMTSSIHSFSTEIDSKTGNDLTSPQSVLIPMSIKVSSANALLIGFRDQKQLSGCRTDYFGRIAIGMEHDGTGATVQSKVGNDNIPYAPISTPQELYHNLARSMHEFGDKEYVTMFMKCDEGRYVTDESCDLYHRSDVQTECAPTVPDARVYHVSEQTSTRQLRCSTNYDQQHDCAMACLDGN
jgi:hypothetical protein